MMDGVAEERQSLEDSRPVETGDPPPVDEQAERITPESFWRKLRRRFWPTAEQRREMMMQRLMELDDAVALNPDTASNYVLRGELYLELGGEDLALMDFRRAKEIAAEQFEESNWGVVAQVMMDRALEGLAKAQRRLERSQRHPQDSDEIGDRQ